MDKTFLTTNTLKGCFVIIGILIAGHCLAYAQKKPREISGVRFDEKIAVGDNLFNLKTVGLLRYKVVFKVYAASLYLGEEVSVKDVFKNVPKRLEFCYFRVIAAEDICLAADRILQRNMTDLQFEKLRTRVDKLHQAYQDVKPKDRYSLTYIPGMGTELRLNSRLLVTIKGADFAEAYFDIWLGKQPLNKDLRDTLLDDPKD